MDINFLYMVVCFTVFLEKVLRVQPNVKKLFLLLRASDDKSAACRLQNEVCESTNILLCWSFKFIYCVTNVYNILIISTKMSFKNL